MTPPTNFLSFLTGTVSPRGIKQIATAVARPQTGLRDMLIADLFAPTHYRCVSRIKSLPGRNHRMARFIAADPSRWPEVMLFTNALVPTTQNPDGSWPAPKDRIYGPTSHVLTVEFDVPDLAFFEEQLRWCRIPSCGKKPMHTPIGGLFQRLSQFDDFEGLSVVWSGHKSAHIHAVFDPRPVLSLVPPGIDPRDGFAAHWCKLEEIVRSILRVEHAADDSLRFPEAFRRVPWGTRVAEAGNILGIPAGTPVPQVVLWEQFRVRRSRAASGCFFTAAPFQPAPQRKLISTPPTRSFGNLTVDQVQHCEAELAALVEAFNRAHGQQYPVLDHLTIEGGVWKAKFRNHEGDRNPASVMTADHSRVEICGANPLGVIPPCLPNTLGLYIGVWVRQMRRAQPIYEVVETHEPEPMTPLEAEFAERAVDRESASTALRDVLSAAVTEHARIWVKAPEGVGKSTALASLASGAGTVMFAFNSYKAAQEKIEEFKASAPEHFAILIRGISREYREACAAVRATPLARGVVEQFANIVEAARAHQPTVAAEMMRRHFEAWRGHRPNQPVAFFTVHDVAEGWADYSFASAYWWRRFWIGDETPARMRMRNRLDWLIYDEVSDRSLIDAVPAVVIDWVEQMRLAAPRVADRSIGLAARRKAFDAHVGSAGFPVAHGKPVSVDFEAACRMLATQDWTRVVTRASGEYERESETATAIDIYEAVTGTEWCIATRRWWNSVASKVVFLTTENLPTAIARRVGGLEVVDLECPKIRRDTIDVHLRRISTASAAKQIEKFRSTHGHMPVISNCAGGLQDVETHHTARGSNAYVGRDVAQTVLHMPPAEYEKLEALNAFLGQAVAVRLRHLDAINQAGGRNLGFRRDGKAKHHLITSPEMLRKLLGLLTRYTRYDFSLVLDGDRWRIRRAA